MAPGSFNPLARNSLNSQKFLSASSTACQTLALHAAERRPNPWVLRHKPEHRSGPWRSRRSAVAGGLEPMAPNRQILGPMVETGLTLFKDIALSFQLRNFPPEAAEFFRIRLKLTFDGKGV